MGWETCSPLVARGLPAASVGTARLGSCDPRLADPSRSVAADLGALGDNDGRQGVRRRVVSGIVVFPERRGLFAALLQAGGCADLSVHADDATLSRYRRSA